MAGLQQQPAGLEADAGAAARQQDAPWRRLE
jgi:hypothetical protein